MEDTKNKFIFLFGLKHVRLSQREEKNIEQLIARYISFEAIPNSEIISVCYTNKIKNKFIDDEDYFHIPVNELKPLNENPANERRIKAFLNFSSYFQKTKK